MPVVRKSPGHVPGFLRWLIEHSYCGQLLPAELIGPVGRLGLRADLKPVLCAPMISTPNRTSHFRRNFLLGFVACVGLIGYALYTQFHDGLLPCPLCIFQRVAFAVLGVVFLVGGLHAPGGVSGRRVYGMLGLLAAGVGMGVAGNHVRLQHLPADQVPACGPGLDYMLEAMPLTGVIRKVMTGSGECAEVDWSFLGLSMPAWSLICFLALAGWALYAAFRRP